jgi:RNA polymerase sigma-70 factor, ECF subfamily
MFNATPDLQQLLTAFRPKILRHMRRFVDAFEAEDLTQTALVKVADGLRNFRENSSLSTWIHRIATNVALDHLRGRSARAAAMLAPLSESIDQSEPVSGRHHGIAEGEAVSVETTLIRREMNECIDQYIEELPESYRAVMVLGEIEGFANKEIAEALGLSVDTVKMRLHRARQQLKNRMANECQFYRDDRNQVACERRHSVNQSHRVATQR